MGSHYYTKDGELIDGDLRLCRKLNGLPSPTTVLNILGSPGLKYYFRRQMFESAVTTPRLPNEGDDDYFDRCCRWADEHGQAARDKGGDFHTLCQKFHELRMRGLFGVRILDMYPDAARIGLEPQFKAYVEWYLNNVSRSLMVEQTVIGQGYAGRVDHVAEMMDGRIACLDVKTQDTTKKKGKFTFYSTWGVQLGAYGGAIKLPNIPDVLISVAVSSNLPAVVEAYEWPKPPAYYHDIFLGLLKYWCEDNDYYPA